MHCLNPKLKPIIGFAKTAIITSTKKKNTNIIKNRDKYYEYMFDGKFPKICVIEDKDKSNTIGAWWGELNASIHLNFGFKGAPLLNDDEAFGFVKLDLNDPLLLENLFICFSITTVFFPLVFAISIFLIDFLAVPVIVNFVFFSITHHSIFINNVSR